MKWADRVLGALKDGPKEAREIAVAIGLNGGNPGDVRNVRMTLYRLEKTGAVFRYRNDTDGPQIWRLPHIPEWKNAWQRQFGVMPPQDVDDFCPVWHFLPGPYEGDPDRRACPRAPSHPAMRVVYEGQMKGGGS